MRIFTPALTLLLGLASLTAHAQDKMTLFSDTVKVNPTVNDKQRDQYHLFIKGYSEKVLNYLKTSPRIAIDFTTENEDVVGVGGAWFYAKKSGQAKMKAIIYQESKIKDYPDWNNKLDSVEFVVKVPATQFNAPLPTVTMDWGKSKAEAIAKTQESYTLFSDTYYAMHPGMTEDERAQFDFFSTGDYEYPLVILGYNEDNQLFSSNIVINDGMRLGYNSESEISGYFKDQGFELLGWDDQGMLIMYRDSDKTQASVVMITIQGQYFRDLNFQYTPDKPTTGISQAKLTPASAKISRSADVLTIDAAEDAGQTVTVFSLSGEVLLRSVLREGVNTLSLGTNKPVIVRVGKHLGVKAF